MVRNFKCKLTNKELKYYRGCFVKLGNCVICNRISLCGLTLPRDPIHHFTEGGVINSSETLLYKEIVINNKVLRICVSEYHDNKFERSVSEFLQFLRDSESRRKSILKLQKANGTLNKTVSFNLTDIQTISSRKIKSTPKNYETRQIRMNDTCSKLEITNYFNGSLSSEKYLKSSQPKKRSSPMNNVSEHPEEQSSDPQFEEINSLQPENKTILPFEHIQILNSEEDVECEENQNFLQSDTNLEEEEHTDIQNQDSLSETDVKFKTSVSSQSEKDGLNKSEKRLSFNRFLKSVKTEMNQERGTAKRKRGRPRKNNPDPPFNPSAPKKKPYAIAKKVQQPVLTESGEKRKRGRPRKKIVFGFQSVVSDIKTIVLPSDLWSAHVSVSSKKSQVCFTRVVQAVSSSVPVECDRSVKFNGSTDYLAQINNRDVLFVGAPKTVDSLKDIEVLLEIVHEIDINDPILQYLQR